MKYFTLGDTVINAAIILLTFAAALAGREEWCYGYVLLVIWQIISITVHVISRSFTKRGTPRRAYQKLAAILAFLFAIGVLAAYGEPSWTYVLLIFTFPLVIIIPIMAIWYTALCFNEYKILKSRRFIQLR